MEKILKVGLQASKEYVVSTSDSASAYGSGDVEVYSTPALIALMEGTSKDCVASCLNEEESTVGIEVNIRHLKATPIGMKVNCHSELVEIKGKRLIFSVTAYDEAGKIGEGIHIRYIINKEEFINKAYKKI
ncbi:thioesterase family protein [Clostridium polynesiense]|uniref:thioesterase family protein n=1 Tax=Clostridium polynesiense TaxID=1325933 RepID=UPI000590AAB5|nr:thioesterase family protein [Clostridium polynesiense]